VRGEHERERGGRGQGAGKRGERGGRARGGRSQRGGRGRGRGAPPWVYRVLVRAVRARLSKI